jgi:Domain of unknown function (DUF4129)
VTDGVQQATERQTQDRLSWSARYARPVLAGLLLIVVLAGIRAARPADTGSGPWHGHVLPLVVALELVLAALLIALWLIGRRRPKPGYPAGILRAGLFRTIPIGMVAVAILAALSHLQLRPSHHTQPAPPAAPKLRTPRGLESAAAQNTDAVTYFLYALLALLLLAAIVACVVILLRRVPAGSAGDVLLPDDDDETLREAIESGRRALRTFDDAQAAIIACYVAMEASLASAGTARGAAETPDELLGRAARSGLLHGGAAGRLTALFYEARYSSHALPGSARDEAVQALDEISAELAHRDENGQLSGTSAPGRAP